MGNIKLAQELTQKISNDLSQYFNKELSKPISLYFKEDEPEHKRQWPTGWNPTEKEHFVLGIHDDFNLEKTWWNLEGVEEEILAGATLEQKYTIALAHEITHIYMFPTPLIAWFQEAIAMNVGKEIAIKIDSSLDNFFPADFPAVSPAELRDYSYDIISRDLDSLKKLQYLSMGLASNYQQDDLVKWVSSNSSEGYDPLEDNRASELVEEQLIKTMPSK